VRWNRVVVLVLLSLSTLWSVAMHVRIAATPLRHQGHVQGAVLVPTALALLATWAAGRGGRIAVRASALPCAAFTFITGFSIGAAYVPAAAAMLLAAGFAAAGRLS